MPAPARRAAGARLRRTGAALGLAGLAFVAVATLTPLRNAHGTALTSPVLCLVCGAQGGADIAANLLLFLPLAVGVRLAGASWGRTVLLCALLSFTVELLQYTVVPGREASLSDLLTNTTSGAIGAAAGGHIPAALRPRPRQAAALLGVGTSALTAALGIAAWLLQPRLPEGGLYSLWAPSHEVFEGQVTSVSLEGRPMPRGGAPPDSAELRRRLERGGFTLAVEVLSGSPTQDREPIYMFRGPSGSALILSQLRREAAVAVPARALRYRLWPPMLSLADGLPAGPGVPVRLTAVEQERRLRLMSSYGGRVRRSELTISPAYGWIMLVPFELATGARVRWITAWCLGVLLLPLGYWAAWIGGPAPWALLAAGLGVMLAAIPAVAGLPPVHWSEWLAGVLGAAAGWALQRLAAYLEWRCVSPSDSAFSSP